jgi:hypothetical protein
MVVEWEAAREDPGLTLRANVTGYEVHRSSDGVHFEKVGEVAASNLRFVDGTASLARRSHYALRLVYRFGLRSFYLSASWRCAGPCFGEATRRTGTLGPAEGGVGSVPTGGEPLSGSP